MGNDSTLNVTGMLAFEPDHQLTPGGTDVTRLVIPTHRKYEKDGEWIEVTTWHRISVFGKPAVNCAKYLQKGSVVLIKGRLEPDKDTGNPRIWQDKSGENKASYDVVADRVVFLANIKSKTAVEQDSFDDSEWD